MDRNLDHLPPRKREELERVAQAIVKACPGVGLVMLFGSYARGDWKEESDIAPEARSGHPSDYDILAVTDDDCDGDVGVWQQLSRESFGWHLSTHIRIIHHELGYLQRQLEKGQYFFSEIVRQGKVLHQDDGFELPEPSMPDRAQQLETAREGFGHWFERARQFRYTADTHQAQGWFPMTAFDLHQAAESAYKALLIVFTGYIPKEHYLELLGEQAAELDARFGGMFPKDDPFRKEAFELLDYAYIGARYDPQYRIDRETLAYLTERVTLLLQRTEMACGERIAKLGEP